MNIKNIFIYLILGLLSALCAVFLSPALAMLLFSVTVTVCIVNHKFFVLIPVLACLITSYILSGTEALISLSLALPSAIVLGFCLLRNFSFGTTIVSASLAQTLVFFGSIFYSVRQLKTSAVNLIFGKPADILALFKEAGNAEFAQQAEELLGYLYNLYDVLLPFIIIMASAVLVYITFGISRFYLEKLGKSFNMPYFHELTLPKSIMNVFIVLSVLSLILGIYSPVLLNVLFIISSIIMVCGLSVLSFYLKRVNTPKIFRVLILALGFAFLSPFAEMLLLFLGIRDSYRNTRSMGN